MRYSFQDEHYLYLVLDHYGSGDLRSAFGQHLWTETDAKIVLVEITSALAHLHSMNIVHRDVKPEVVVLI